MSQGSETIAKGTNVCFITGAGLSVASGITPYRAKEGAIWDRFVTEWGTRRLFKRDPTEWWNGFWLRTHEKPEFLKAVPNAGHYAITDLVRISGVNVVTQNIDGLHTRAGLCDDRLVQVHGQLGRYKCVQTGCPYASSKVITIPSLDDFAEEWTSMDGGNLRVTVPRCPGCTNPIMPLSLFFDEDYSSHVAFKWGTVHRWLGQSSVLVFVGTSFSVGVTSDAIGASHHDEKVIYNFNIVPEDTHPKSFMFRHIIGPSEETLPLLVKFIRECLHPKAKGGKRRPPRMYCWTQKGAGG
ncbi:sirtuin family protein [Kipferlia bialata]|uniref:Sirtuin family protein n=1 Tax=Kipferlia bialata TaxID=797122 RepID=A0A9K3CWG3_9EUKA|nr:sirtuin family protein [Kipferlia bialata]|eukprot:g6037.t1